MKMVSVHRLLFIVVAMGCDIVSLYAHGWSPLNYDDFMSLCTLDTEGPFPMTRLRDRAIAELTASITHGTGAYRAATGVLDTDYAHLYMYNPEVEARILSSCGTDKLQRRGESELDVCKLSLSTAVILPPAAQLRGGFAPLDVQRVQDTPTRVGFSLNSAPSNSSSDIIVQLRKGSVMESFVQHLSTQYLMPKAKSPKPLGTAEQSAADMVCNVGTFSGAETAVLDCWIMFDSLSSNYRHSHHVSLLGSNVDLSKQLQLLSAAPETKHRGSAQLSYLKSFINHRSIVPLLFYGFN
eukprot:Lankesteria_metandrocarpae@DN7731_c0_g1_i1.p1